MSKQALNDDLKKKILSVIQSYPISRAGVFGSVVRGEATDNSDIDLLIEVQPQAGFNFDHYLKLKKDLKKATNRDVDLSQYKLLKPALKEYIFSEEVRIYEKNS